MGEIMIIDVDGLPEQGMNVSRDFEFFGADLVEENAVFIKPVHAELTVKKQGREILVKGKIITCLSFICSRCLVPFEFPVDSRFDLVYLPEELDVIKEQLETSDMNKLFYYSRKINLRDVVLEQLNLLIPIKPLCSQDCQGICPVCGQIIRNSRCACVGEKADPRLEKLKIFIRDKK